MRLTTDSQTKPIPRGSGGGGSEGPAGGCPGSKASASCHSSLESQSLEAMEEEKRKGRRQDVAMRSDLLQLNAVLSGCSALRDTVHLCTGYFKKGRRKWTEVQAPSTALCFFKC